MTVDKYTKLQHTGRESWRAGRRQGFLRGLALGAVTVFAVLVLLHVIIRVCWKPDPDKSEVVRWSFVTQDGKQVDQLITETVVMVTVVNNTQMVFDYRNKVVVEQDFDQLQRQHGPCYLRRLDLDQDPSYESFISTEKRVPNVSVKRSEDSWRVISLELPPYKLSPLAADMCSGSELMWLESPKKHSVQKRDADGCIPISTKCGPSEGGCKWCRYRKLCQGRVTDEPVKRCDQNQLPEGGNSVNQGLSHTKKFRQKQQTGCVEIFKRCRPSNSGCQSCRIRTLCNGRIRDNTVHEC